jgi:hypothetical protein
MGLKHLVIHEFAGVPGASENIAAGYDIGDTLRDTNTDELYTCIGDGVWRSFSAVVELKRSQIRQDSANWINGLGQRIRVGGSGSWVNYHEEDFGDLDDFHDQTAYETGTATGTHSATTLQDTSKVWSVDQWAGYTVKITSGTNADEVVKILSNTSDTLTVDSDWITTVDNTSGYEISLKTRLTVPQDGLYLVSPRNTFSASSGRLFGTYIYVNNVFYNNTFFSLAIAVETTVPYPTEFIELSAGDYVEIKAYQGGAGAHNLLAFGNRVRCTIAKLGN